MNYARYGLWEVTTEGDVEGRSTTRLGTYTGNFDEIAAALADKCFYSLEFKLVEPETNIEQIPLTKDVSVRFAIDSGTWDMSSKDREEFFNKLIPADSPVIVKSGNYFAGVALSPKNPPSPEEIAKLNLIKKLKLSNEDLKILGVEM